MMRVVRVIVVRRMIRLSVVKRVMGVVAAIVVAVEGEWRALEPGLYIDTRFVNNVVSLVGMLADRVRCFAQHILESILCVIEKLLA